MTLKYRVTRYTSYFCWLKPFQNKAMPHGGNNIYIFKHKTEHNTWYFNLIWHVTYHEMPSSRIHVCASTRFQIYSMLLIRQTRFLCFHWHTMGQRWLRHVALSSREMSAPGKATGLLDTLLSNAAMILIDIFHRREVVWDIISSYCCNQMVSEPPGLRSGLTSETVIILRGMGKFKCKTLRKLVLLKA